MILNINTPVYNTVIVFSIVMILIYVIKPDVLYDNKKKEFRQFGSVDGKTLLPIHLISVIMAIILYLFFFHISSASKTSPVSPLLSVSSHNDSKIINETVNLADKTSTVTISANEYKYLQQQLDLQKIQINQIMQQQLTSQILNQQSLDNIVHKTNTVTLPNSLSI